MNIFHCLNLTEVDGAAAVVAAAVVAAAVVAAAVVVAAAAVAVVAAVVVDAAAATVEMVVDDAAVATVEDRPNRNRDSPDPPSHLSQNRSPWFPLLSRIIIYFPLYNEVL